MWRPFSCGAEPADAVPQAPSALPASSPKRFEDATFRLRSGALSSPDTP